MTIPTFDEQATADLLATIENAKTRQDVVPAYAAGIMHKPGPRFLPANEAITAKWSKAGLRWIKQQAWKIVDAETLKQSRADAGTIWAIQENGLILVELAECLWPVNAEDIQPAKEATP